MPPAKQLFMVLSILFLILCTVLACYGAFRSRELSLPISSVLTAFNILLPAVAGFSVETAVASKRHQQSRRGQRSGPSYGTIAVFLLLTVYETVLVTLAGSHIGPVESLSCPLDQRWMKLFRNKDARAIKGIQERFDCCGLHTPVDRAWPFPDKTHTAKSCQELLGRTRGCFNALLSEERKIGVVLLMVPILVFAWQAFVLLDPGRSETWTPNGIYPQISGVDDVPDGANESRGYIDSGEQYSDNPVVEVVDDNVDGQHTQAATEHRPRQLIDALQRSATTGHLNLDRERNEWAEA